MDETLRWAIGIISTFGLAIGTIIIRAFSRHSERLTKLETAFDYLASDIGTIKKDVKCLLTHHEEYRCPLVRKDQ